MVLYPATVLFRATHAMEEALKDLGAGQELATADSVDMKQFEKILDIDRWRRIEKTFRGGPHWDEA
jgi:hypothetical protein